jgi:ferric-dicitrate binding protein FerR (iron transport regulator)
MEAHDDDAAAPLDATTRAALDAWTTAAPPAGFADRVLEARAATRAEAASTTARPARWRGGPIAAALVAAAALAWVVATRAPSAPSAHGALAAERRTTIELGGRGVAVAEPGAALTWEVERGSAVVSQAGGSVFYRVEHQGPFTVETPAGKVEVTGTCFRVEVEPMTKKQPVQGIVGAALGAALVVTVYEGSVLFADKGGGTRAAAAGERIVVAPGEGGVAAAGAPTPAGGEAAGAAIALAAPPADISRDDLLVRDRVQRDEIAALRGKVRELEQAGGGRGPRDRDASGRPWFDPSPADLAAFAKECRVRVDLPPLADRVRATGPEDAKELGLVDGEPAILDAATTTVLDRYAAGLRAIYLEVTGNQAGADELSMQAMASEIRDKSGEGEDGRVRALIARERAGLARPPADVSKLSPYERQFRLMASLGDDLERELGVALGADRAHAIREAAGGWPMRMEMAGCSATAGAP